MNRTKTSRSLDLCRPSLFFLLTALVATVMSVPHAHAQGFSYQSDEDLRKAAERAAALPPYAHYPMLRLNRLDPQRVARMPKEAVQTYENALQAIDRILYERGIKLLQDALAKDPGNEHLRFIVIQLATYLGDTRWGTDSITYYDIAITQLKQMMTSPMLNLREQHRAQEALDKLLALQRTVAERDASRRKWGLEVAKLYLQESRGRSSEKSKEVRKGLALREQVSRLDSEGKNAGKAAKSSGSKSGK